MADMIRAAHKAIDNAATDLNDLSQQIWNNPELNFKETFAHEFLTNWLEKSGFTVERRYKGLKTAFRACYGDDDARPHVVVFCEYDALPEIGHGCGHNLIAEVGVAAGLGIKAALEASGGGIGKLTVMGSPAEEGGGGKVELINRGALEGVDAAVMSHPSGFDIKQYRTLAITQVTVTYTGRASHASASPWEGINALDAAVLGYQNLACLRQQIRPDWKMHAYHQLAEAEWFKLTPEGRSLTTLLRDNKVVITSGLCNSGAVEDDAYEAATMGVITNGGAKPNIIPEKTTMEFYFRAPCAADLLALIQKATGCLEAAATATGCTVDIQFDNYPYLDMVHNPTLSDLYVKHAESLGVDFSGEVKRSSGSTDMGNVSYTVPSIHPMFDVAHGVSTHSRAFTAAAGAPTAQQRTLTEGKILAGVVIDFMKNLDLRQSAKSQFQQDMADRDIEAVRKLLLKCSNPLADSGKTT